MAASDGRVWLSVPFDRKDEAKHLGARWSRFALLWYAPDSRYVDLIQRFPFFETAAETARRQRRCQTRAGLTDSQPAAGGRPDGQADGRPGRAPARLPARP